MFNRLKIILICYIISISSSYVLSDTTWNPTVSPENPHILDDIKLQVEGLNVSDNYPYVDLNFSYDNKSYYNLTNMISENKDPQTTFYLPRYSYPIKIGSIGEKGIPFYVYKNNEWTEKFSLDFRFEKAGDYITKTSSVEFNITFRNSSEIVDINCYNSSLNRWYNISLEISQRTGSFRILDIEVSNNSTNHFESTLFTSFTNTTIYYANKTKAEHLTSNSNLFDNNQNVGDCVLIKCANYYLWTNNLEDNYSESYKYHNITVDEGQGNYYVSISSIFYESLNTNNSYKMNISSSFGYLPIFNNTYTNLDIQRDWWNEKLENLKLIYEAVFNNSTNKVTHTGSDWDTWEVEELDLVEDNIEILDITFSPTFANQEDNISISINLSDAAAYVFLDYFYYKFSNSINITYKKVQLQNIDENSWKINLGTFESPAILNYSFRIYNILRDLKTTSNYTTTIGRFGFNGSEVFIDKPISKFGKISLKVLIDENEINPNSYNATEDSCDFIYDWGKLSFKFISISDYSLVEVTLQQENYNLPHRIVGTYSGFKDDVKKEIGVTTQFTDEEMIFSNQYFAYSSEFRYSLTKGSAYSFGTLIYHKNEESWDLPSKNTNQIIISQDNPKININTSNTQSSSKILFYMLNSTSSDVSQPSKFMNYPFPFEIQSSEGVEIKKNSWVEGIILKKTETISECNFTHFSDFLIKISNDNSTYWWYKDTGFENIQTIAGQDYVYLNLSEYTQGIFRNFPPECFSYQDTKRTIENKPNLVAIEPNINILQYKHVDENIIGTFEIIAVPTPLIFNLSSNIDIENFPIILEDEDVNSLYAVYKNGSRSRLDKITFSEDEGLFYVKLKANEEVRVGIDTLPPVPTEQYSKSKGKVTFTYTAFDWLSGINNIRLVYSFDNVNWQQIDMEYKSGKFTKELNTDSKFIFYKAILTDNANNTFETNINYIEIEQDDSFISFDDKNTAILGLLSLLGVSLAIGAIRVKRQ